MSPYLLAYYGDDFTGSADVMEALVLGGVPTVLFLEPPTPEFVREHFPAVQAVGVAGISRTMSPRQMDQVLIPTFTALKALGAPLFHYKICSTFDSAPTIGSIGQAIEIGRMVFESQAVPLVVGAPALKRYVIFGNLFATVASQTYRLDRHPTMSKHPITPMAESDIRLHLAQQTDRAIGLIDTLQLNGPAAELDTAYQTLVRSGSEIILFDTFDSRHLQSIGRLLWEGRSDRRAFIVGSSGVEYALSAHWDGADGARAPIALPPLTAVDQLVVVCGSASPTTQNQIEWALANGYCGIRLESSALIDPARSDLARGQIMQAALTALGKGQSVILYSVLGPDDRTLAETRAAGKRLALSTEAISAALGTQQGLILRTILEQTGLKRACVAGGDTSGHVAQQLGIYALEIATPIAPGAPLCRATSRYPAIDPLQIAFKGGQNGRTDYFGAIQRGHA